VFNFTRFTKPIPSPGTLPQHQTIISSSRASGAGCGEAEALDFLFFFKQKIAQSALSPLPIADILTPRLNLNTLTFADIVFRKKVNDSMDTFIGKAPLNHVTTPPLPWHVKPRLPESRDQSNVGGAVAFNIHIY
jgi:hypothetical protein